jgi:putative nucleotidyltransferase with HDIG domain
MMSQSAIEKAPFRRKRAGVRQGGEPGRAWTAAAGADAHLRRRGAQAVVIAATFSATAVSVFWAVASDRQVHVLRSAVEAGAVAATAVFLAAALLYFLAHRYRGWLFHTTSLVARQSVDLFMVLGKLTELRDRETASHTLRVALYALMFAEALDLPASTLVRVVKGALLHDIGKIAIPDHILNKPGPLTAEERATMQTHVERGLSVVAQSSVLADAAPVVAAHHERYDGEGYPLALSGEIVPYEARLFALADVFDALTSRRPYKRALLVEETLVLMASERGSRFDPVLFDRFFQLAPGFAAQMPQQAETLRALLMQRLQPYLDRFIFVEPTNAGASQLLMALRLNSTND